MSPERVKLIRETWARVRAWAAERFARGERAVVAAVMPAPAGQPFPGHLIASDVDRFRLTFRVIHHSRDDRGVWRTIECEGLTVEIVRE